MRGPVDRFELSQKIREWHLSQRQVEACRGWAEHGDLPRAMIEAGYKNAADNSELLQMQKKFNEDPRLMELVTIFRTYSSLRTGVNRDQIVAELSAMAFSRVNDYMDWNGGRITLKESSTLTEAQQAAILEVSETVARDGSRTVKIKLQNKQTALDRLAQLLDEEEDRVKRAGRPGVDVLAINAGNVKMMLANIGTRKAVERLCSDFFNYDLQLDPSMQKAITQFTEMPLPGNKGAGLGYESKHLDPTTAPKRTAKEMLEIIDLDPADGEDPMAPMGRELSGITDPLNRVDKGRPAYGEDEEDVFQKGPVEPARSFTKEEIDDILDEVIDGADDEQYERMADDLADYGDPPEPPKISRVAQRVAKRKALTPEQKALAAARQKRHRDRVRESAAAVPAPAPAPGSKVRK